jgi:acylphosphatase
MARTEKKKTTSKSNDDATAGVQQMSLKDRDDESSDPEEDDDDKNEDEDENVPMSGLPKVLGKSTPARSTRVEDRVVCTTWYQTFINVNQEAAAYLYDREELTKPSDWSKLNEKTVGMIVKNCRDGEVHVNATAASKMVLLAFLCKHQERIQRPLFEMTNVDEDMLEDIERQMQLEEQYLNEKARADPPSLPLDEANVTRSISTFQSIASRERGITSIPLSYVIRFDPLVPAAHLDPPFGMDESDYSSMDDEMIRRAEIYSREVNVNEDKGPFSKVFLIDAATVYTLMEKAFGKTSFWTNVRQYAKKKEGRKAWIALIRFYFGNDRATTMADSLRTKLQKTQFSGPRRGFDFTKYCNLHTNAHTSASEILLYQQDQTPIFSESNKIMLFQQGITDPYFNTVKALINSQRYKYGTFEVVKEAYLNYMRTT